MDGAEKEPVSRGDAVMDLIELWAGMTAEQRAELAAIPTESLVAGRGRSEVVRILGPELGEEAWRLLCGALGRQR